MVSANYVKNCIKMCEWSRVLGKGLNGLWINSGGSNTELHRRRRVRVKVKYTTKMRENITTLEPTSGPDLGLYGLQ